MMEVSESMLNLGQCLAGLSLGVPVRGATDFTEHQDLRSITTILRIEHFGLHRAEQEDECLKLIKFSFSPVDQGLQYVSPSFSVHVCLHASLSPAHKVHTHLL